LALPLLKIKRVYDFCRIASMTHRRITTAVVVFAWAFVFVTEIVMAEPRSTDRPNLIVIMVDDMGNAGVSCFGNPYFETPEVDRLAAEGMRLTDFHSSGAVCSPTRTGLLTGRYQQRAGIETVIYPVHDHPEYGKGLADSDHTSALAAGAQVEGPNLKCRSPPLH
jgi:hypothetical protein